MNWDPEAEADRKLSIQPWLSSAGTCRLLVSWELTHDADWLLPRALAAGTPGSRRELPRPSPCAQDRLDTRQVPATPRPLGLEEHALPRQAPPLVSRLNALPWADWQMTPERHQATPGGEHRAHPGSPCRAHLMTRAPSCTCLSISLSLELKRKG